MKNLFKYLGAFAIAGAIGLSTMNVNAADLKCEADEEVHTNYYIFLHSQPASVYKNGIAGMAAGKYFTFYNGTNKYNNIQGKGTNGVNGVIPVTRGSLSNSPTDGNYPEGTWTVKEFWEKYKTAILNAKAIKTDNDPEKDLGISVYEDTANKTSYLMHEKWLSWDGGFNGTPTSKSEAANIPFLKTYLQGVTNFSSSPIISDGTNLPTTTIDAPGQLFTSTATALEWKITRVFHTGDDVNGVNIGMDEPRVYSPAVAYAKYCVKKTGTDPNPETPVDKKKIDYNKNTTDTVTLMPSPNPFEFTDKCINLSTSVPSRSGYKFKGWAETSNGSVKYQPGAEYCGNSTILYAIWEPVQNGPFTITYDANGGSGAPAKQSGIVGTPEKISSTEPKLAKNKFLGWALNNPKATEPTPGYQKGNEYAGTQGDITLYAVWQPITGINSNIIVFGAVALAAGAGLIVAKKKNLFKQI